jgi:hypothetical protein
VRGRLRILTEYELARVEDNAGNLHVAPVEARSRYRRSTGPGPTTWSALLARREDWLRLGSGHRVAVRPPRLDGHRIAVHIRRLDDQNVAGRVLRDVTGHGPEQLTVGGAEAISS